MREWVRDVIARFGVILRGLVVSRPLTTPPAKRIEAEIDVPAKIYRIAASARPRKAGRGWSVCCDDRADAVAAGLTLAQAKTFCRLLNTLSNFGAADHRLSTGTRPPRIQSPDR